jgi:uroporphyrinogen decarboxylase
VKLRQDRMSSKERMDALFTYRQPDRVPIGMFATVFSSINAGCTVTTAYGDPEKSFHAMVWTAEQYGWDPIFQHFGHTVLGSWDFGGEVRLPKGEYEGGMVTESYPVKSERDVLNLKMPDPKTAGRIPKVLEFSKLQEAHALPIWFYSRSPFTQAANICGLDQFSKWMIKKPDLCEKLMTIAIDHTFNVLSYWVETFGVEKIFVFMSSPSESNQVISPRQFEKLALPYHSEYHKRLSATGIKRFCFHICGDQNLNLPYLEDLSPWPHPSVLSFGHEVDLELAGRYFPKDIIFGNIEPAAIQTGTPQQVYELSKIAIEKGKKAPGGFMLGPGCHLLMAPPVNVFAVTKAVNDLGWYE